MPWWCLRCLCYDNKLFPLEKQKVHFSKDCMLYDTSSASAYRTAYNDPLYPRAGDLFVDFPNINPTIHYSLVKKIGKGGFGTVMLCKDRRTKKMVALKRIRGHPRNEVIVTKKVKHKSIVKYIGSYSFSNRTALVLEYIPDGKLSELIRNEDNGHVPILQEMCISFISKQCLGALRYIHKRNIIHLDLKADNIFVNILGKVILFDFGLSAELPSRECVSRYVRGTKGWLAPEISKSRIYSAKSDIWSFGMTVVEMIMGSPLRKSYYTKNTSGREWLDQTELYKTHGTILSEVIQEFLANSLTINYHKRPSAEQLLKYTFIEAYSHRSMKQIARNMLENLMKNC